MGARNPWSDLHLAPPAEDVIGTWVGIPGGPPYVIPRGSAGLKKHSIIKHSSVDNVT